MKDSGSFRYQEALFQEGNICQNILFRFLRHKDGNKELEYRRFAQNQKPLFPGERRRVRPSNKLYPFLGHNRRPYRKGEFLL